MKLMNIDLRTKTRDFKTAPQTHSHKPRSSQHLIQYLHDALATAQRKRTPTACRTKASKWALAMDLSGPSAGQFPPAPGHTATSYTSHYALATPQRKRTRKHFERVVQSGCLPPIVAAQTQASFPAPELRI